MFPIVLALLCLQFNGIIKASPVVHLVPHSHCDPGYRKTFNDYYKSQVHSILDTVLQALTEDKRRKFVWEEVSFLSKWWTNDASSDQKATMRQLLSEERLEFIGGGWVMHDEAVTNAFTINTQMTLGLKFLREVFDSRPQYEWHIDPFGHSSLMPELYSALRYKAIVINRIPNDVKQRMKETKSLEFYWESPYSNVLMFTHVLGEHYQTPAMLGLNTRERAESFVTTCKKRLSWSRTDNVLVPFGNDFAFINASEKFSIMDEVVDYINSHFESFGLTIQYSTLNDYFTAVLNGGTTFPLIHGGDFFPYIACYPCLSEKCDGVAGSLDSPCGYLTDDGYWSGFFTSKPSQKVLARKQDLSTIELQSLHALVPMPLDAANYTSIVESLAYSKETVSLLAHHDAITGTSFPTCYDDYNNRLRGAMSEAERSAAIFKEYALCKKQISLLSPDIAASLNELNNDNNVSIVVFVPFNPDGHKRSMYFEVIDLPPGLCVKVYNNTIDDGMKPVPHQQVKNKLYIPLNILAFGLKVLYLQKANCSSKEEVALESSDGFVLDNGVIQLSFGSNNQLASWKNTKTGDSMDISIGFEQYLEKEAPSFIPHSVCDGTNVYTFVPDEGSQILIDPTTTLPTTQTASGPLVWEIIQEIPTDACPIKMALRLFKPINENDLYNYFVEIQPIVGPLSESVDNSISVVFQTDINSGNNFTTYTSGLYPMSRVYENDVPIQKNFYPLVGHADIRDPKGHKGLVIATKRPMAVTATRGKMELLTHRRLSMLDDPRGNDDSIVNDTMLVGLTYPNGSLSLHAMQQLQAPFTAHVGVLHNSVSWDCQTEWNLFIQTLPDSVHIISVEQLQVLPNTDSIIGIRLITPGIVTGFNLVDILKSNWNVKGINETTPDFGITLSNVTTMDLLPMEMVSLTMLVSPIPPPP